MEPICPACIALLAAAAGQAAPAAETIEAATIKRVLSERLGLEGADEVLSVLRAASEDNDDADD